MQKKSIGLVTAAIYYESGVKGWGWYRAYLEQWFEDLNPATSTYERPLTKHEQRAKEIKAEGHVLARQHYTQKEAI